jgi:hypothetical protein
MSEEDIIHVVLSKVLVGMRVATEAVPSGSSKKTAGASRASKGESEEKVKRKRAIPDDEERCMARTLDEKIHTENGSRGGILKVMREDPLNLYGDRCLGKKSGDCDFCKIHEFKQTLGVWDGEYRDRFRLAVEKSESESSKKGSRGRSVPPALKKKIQEDEEEEEVPVAKIVRKPSAAVRAASKAPVAKKAVPKEKASIFSDDEEEPKASSRAPVPKKAVPKEKASIFSDDEEEPKALGRAPSKALGPSGRAPKTLSVEDLQLDSPPKKVLKMADSQETEPLEEAEVEAVDIEIEGEKYSIDKEGNVYNEEGEAVGVYNVEKKTWTVRYEEN